MQTQRHYTDDIIANTKQPLGRMPIRSSVMARQMLKADLPVPETLQDIERYVHDLLNHKEQQVCDMATD